MSNKKRMYVFVYNDPDFPEYSHTKAEFWDRNSQNTRHYRKHKMPEYLSDFIHTASSQPHLYNVNVILKQDHASVWVIQK